MSNLDDRTVPFFKVSQADRNRALENMRLYTGGDPTKLTSDLAVTAFKSLIGSGSQIVAVPRVVSAQFGPTLRISVKDLKVPAFVSLAQLRSFM